MMSSYSAGLLDGSGDKNTYVNDAGMVLLGPFIPRLFENVSIIQGNTLVDPARALALLHYLLTGSTTPSTQSLIISRILCGINLDKDTDQFVLLSAPERAEADKMLESVLNTWSSLHVSSLDALRQSFLSRSGKLTPGDEYILSVERFSYDILLNNLPWGFRRIRLPWMRNILDVMW